MKKIITILFLLVAYIIEAQVTYNPVNAIPVNKPIGIALQWPTDARSYYYDPSLFLWRPFASTSEVLSYLNLPKYRSGQFSIYVNVGGTLNPNGTFTGGVIYEYWFKDGTGDGNLVLKYPFVGTSSQIIMGDASLNNIGTGLGISGGALVINPSGATAGVYTIPSYQVNLQGQIIKSGTGLFNNIGSGTASMYTSTRSVGGLTITDFNTRLFHDTTYLSWHLRGDGSIFGLIDTAGLRSAIGGGSPGGGVWGSITGTLSAQTDLQTALNGKLSTSLTSADIYLGDGSNVAAMVSPTGAWTINNAGVSTLTANSVVTSNITNNNVTYGKIQQVNGSRLVGNPTGSAANMSEISVADGIKFNGTSLVADTAFIYNNARIDTIRIVPVGASGLQTIYGNGTDTIWNKKLVAGSNITLTQNTDSSITIASTGGGGSLTAKQIGFGSASNTLTGSARFIFDSVQITASSAFTQRASIFGTSSQDLTSFNDVSWKVIGNIAYIGDTTQGQPTWLEFGGYAGNKVRMFVGHLGTLEWNEGQNLNYRSSIHQYYDTTQDIIYTYQGSNGWGVQTVGSGHSNFSSPGVKQDVYNLFGRIPYRIDWIRSGVDYIGSTLSINRLQVYDELTTNAAMTTGTKGIFHVNSAAMLYSGTPVFTFQDTVAVGIGGTGQSGFNLTITSTTNDKSVDYFNNDNSSHTNKVRWDKAKAGSHNLGAGIDNAFQDINGGVADEEWTSTANAPGSFSNFRKRWRTTNAAGSLAERMSLGEEGDLEIGTSTAIASSILTVASTTKGFLPPRMTSAQRTGISTPATGLIVFDTDTASTFQYNGSAWQNLFNTGSGGGSGVDTGQVFTNGLTNSISGTTSTNKLGGSLIQNTSIDQGSFDMQFKTGSTNLLNIDHLNTKIDVPIGNFGGGTYQSGYGFQLESTTGDTKYLLRNDRNTSNTNIFEALKSKAGSFTIGVGTVVLKIDANTMSSAQFVGTNNTGPGLSTIDWTFNSINNASVSAERIRFTAEGNALFGTNSDVSTDRVRINGGRLSMLGNNTLANQGLNGVQLSLQAATYTDNSTASTGTVTHTVVNSISTPTLAASNTSVTYSNASTLYIAAAPTAGTNVSITTPWAEYIASGNLFVGGGISIGSTSSNIFVNSGTMQLSTGNGVPKLQIDNAGQVMISATQNPNNRRLFIDGSIGATKDSITTITSNGGNFVLTIDTANSGQFKKILPANIGGLNAAPLYSVVTADPADWTAAISTMTELPDLTGAADHTVALPTASTVTGKTIILWNKNASGTFHWTFASAVTVPAGTTTSAIANGTMVTLISDGSVWVEQNVQ